MPDEIGVDNPAFRELLANSYYWMYPTSAQILTGAWQVWSIVLESDQATITVTSHDDKLTYRMFVEEILPSMGGKDPVQIPLNCVVKIAVPSGESIYVSPLKDRA